jgi:GAF domain-containing protein
VAEGDAPDGTPDDVRFLRGLRARLLTAAAAGRLNPSGGHTAVLERGVQTAMDLLHAGAASLYLVDQKQAELVFQVALGSHARGLIGRRLPMGRGIAGWVAATGEMIAVADVQRDPRWAQEVAAAVGYAPQTMLAAPLLVAGETVGVLQILDKEGGRPFDGADMELMGRLADQTALVISQSLQLQSLSLLLRASIADLAGPEARAAIAAEADAFAQRIEDSAEYADTVELAGLLGEIAQRDDEGRRFCLQLVGVIAAYLRSHSR